MKLVSVSIKDEKLVVYSENKEGFKMLAEALRKYGIRAEEVFSSLCG